MLQNSILMVRSFTLLGERLSCTCNTNDIFQYLDNASENICSKFIDQFITCERASDPEMEEVFRYQNHKHSQTCKKQNKSCRFGFPKPPLDQTRILTPLPKEFDQVLKKKGKQNYEAITAVLDQLGRDHLEDIPFDDFLGSLGITYGEYIIAIRSSIQRSTVFLKRSTNAVFVNAYNKKILEAWRAT